MPQITSKMLSQWREAECLKPSTTEVKTSKNPKPEKPPPPIRKPPRGTVRPNPLPLITSFNEPLPMPPSRTYTGYRTGLLKKVYQCINSNDAFVQDCMTDPELNELIENSAITSLDTVGGLPKLALTLFSKYNIHKQC